MGLTSSHILSTPNLTLWIAKYIETDFSLLRSKIRELHPVHRASLEALLRHIYCVASHWEKNAMTVEVLAAQFRYIVFRGNEVLQDDIDMKVRRVSPDVNFSN
jgi:hypothetical protein